MGSSPAGRAKTTLTCSDLSPEFIPVLGPLDDVVVAVLGLRYVRRRLGNDDLRARWRGSPGGLPCSSRSWADRRLGR